MEVQDESDEDDVEDDASVVCAVQPVASPSSHQTQHTRVGKWSGQHLACVLSVIVLLASVCMFYCLEDPVLSAKSTVAHFLDRIGGTDNSLEVVDNLEVVEVVPRKIRRRSAV